MEAIDFLAEDKLYIQIGEGIDIRQGDLVFHDLDIEEALFKVCELCMFNEVSVTGGYIEACNTQERVIELEDFLFMIMGSLTLVPSSVTTNLIEWVWL